jgi:probable rRNA maturation factor
MSGTKHNKASPAVEILIESSLWQAVPEAERVLRSAIAAAAAAVSTSAGEVAILLTDDSAIQALNRGGRAKDEPTNVLSFPAPEPLPGAPVMLGDIVIAYETVSREAAAERKPIADHLSHLVVHGFLHLMGYDHDADEEAAAMERLETEILVRLGVPDPYRLLEAQT